MQTQAIKDITPGKTSFWNEEEAHFQTNKTKEFYCYHICLRKKNANGDVQDKILKYYVII